MSQKIDKRPFPNTVEKYFLQDKNCKLQRDYTQLYSHAEHLNYEFSTKLKSLNYVEDKNFVLERENNELRNKIGRFVRPYSFNK